MKDYNVHLLIEEQDKEGKARLWEKIRQKAEDLPEWTEVRAPRRRRRINAKRAGSIAATAACLCLVCVAILLPFLLQENEIRYTNTGDFILSDMKTTVKEYAESTQTKLLYVDWYSQAEITTRVYVRADNGDFACIVESASKYETGETVTIYLAPEHIDISEFVMFAGYCKQECDVAGIPVRYFNGQQGGMAVFAYKGYTYFVGLQNPQDETYILSVVETMILSE
ncbi:MAG: hypothetical protein HFE47_07825 [Clostridia bacterium]|nr:hypothetical protein [Clostridia bacterium]